MEVLMTRRASRTLMGVLSVTTVVGLSAYAIAHRTKGSTPTAKPGTVTLMAVGAPDGPTTKPLSSGKPPEGKVVVPPGAAGAKVDAPPVKLAAAVVPPVASSAA